LARVWDRVRVRIRVRDRVRISLRLTLTLTLTLNNDYTTLLISRLYCNIYTSMRRLNWPSCKVRKRTDPNTLANASKFNSSLQRNYSSTSCGHHNVILLLIVLIISNISNNMNNIRNCGCGSICQISTRRFTKLM